MAPNPESILSQQSMSTKSDTTVTKRLQTDTEAIIVTVFSKRIGISSTHTTVRPLSPSSRKSCTILLNLVDEAIVKYQKAFNGMYKSVDLEQDKGRINGMIKSVTDEMLQDGSLNWGRLVTLISFVLHVVENLVRKDSADSECVISAASYLSNYIDTQLGTHLKQLGGWEELEVLFPHKPNYEQMAWNGLLGTFVGLGVFSLAIPTLRYIIQ